MTIETNLRIVREIAETALRTAIAQRRDVSVGIAIYDRDDTPLSQDAFRALHGAVVAEYDRLAAASRQDKQSRSVREDSSAAKRVLAYLDDHRARYPYDATGVIADLPAAYDNGLLPLHELLESDLRDLLAENARLRMQNDELFTENHEMQYGPTVSAED